MTTAAVAPQLLPNKEAENLTFDDDRRREVQGIASEFLYM